MLVGISEAICILYFKTFSTEAVYYSIFSVPILMKTDLQNPYQFQEWLAGLIDADGCFLLSKKGYAALEITMDIRDKKA